jgi:hypothetical protein
MQSAAHSYRSHLHLTVEHCWMLTTGPSGEIILALGTIFRGAVLRRLTENHCAPIGASIATSSRLATRGGGPKACFGELRGRVIKAVETGASRREAAERFDASASSAVK